MMVVAGMTFSFLSTPSLRRATSATFGRSFFSSLFLSTPSLRRATHLFVVGDRYFLISIHALLAEGDPAVRRSLPHWRYFYPRPPCGGRRTAPGHAVERR